MTLLFGTAGDARVPELGASGAIAAVLGAYFVLYPGSRILTYIVPVFLVRIPAWIFLGLWFLYQLIEANFGLFSAGANGGGVAFFAHVGGFVFGLVVARVLTGRDASSPRRSSGLDHRTRAQLGAAMARSIAMTASAETADQATAWWEVLRWRHRYILSLLLQPEPEIRHRSGQQREPVAHQPVAEHHYRSRGSGPPGYRVAAPIAAASHPSPPGCKRAS